MFERPATGERAVLVHMDLGREADPEDLSEFEDLVCAAGATPVNVVTGYRRAPRAGTFIGSGKIEEIVACLAELQGEVVIFNHELSPAQERNLEGHLKCRVLDRIGLILDIFAQRANTFEGKLQVELAQLRHLSTRLVRGWSHLERQKGGIGLRGPGEKQLETDRRLLNERIKQINRRLDGVRRRRGLSRRARGRAEVPVVALVGYTNAGKSTLFNALTGATAHVADQLFATLDPTLRRLRLGGSQTIVLADTVGFVRRLPHELVAAFRATLEETRGATLLLHVIDGAAADWAEKRAEVNSVLAAIGADDIPQLEVYNKLDMDAFEVTGAAAGSGVCANGTTRLKVSAKTGVGLSAILDTLKEQLSVNMVRHRVRLPPAAGRLRARLFEYGDVIEEQTSENGDVVLDVALPVANFERLCRVEGLAEWLETSS